MARPKRESPARAGAPPLDMAPRRVRRTVIQCEPGTDPVAVLQAPQLGAPSRSTSCLSSTPITSRSARVSVIKTNGTVERVS